MRVLYKGYLYESLEWDLLYLGERFKNKQFRSKEEAEKAVRKYGAENGIEYYSIEPNIVFNELGDGQVKVAVKQISPIEKELKPKEERLEYLTNKELTREQLGLYRSYYPVEFGSNQRAKTLQVPIDELELTEKNQSSENVESIKNAILSGVELPPPIVDEEYSVLDGHHRVVAAKELGISHIPVIYLFEP